jgi:hypothetical protein
LTSAFAAVLESAMARLRSPHEWIMVFGGIT